MDEIDLSTMSEEEIATLGARCMECLSLADKVQLVLKVFHDNESREELKEWLDDAISENGDEEEGV